MDILCYTRTKLQYNNLYELNSMPGYSSPCQFISVDWDYSSSRTVGRNMGTLFKRSAKG